MVKYTQGDWTVSNSGGKVIIGGMKHPTTIATLETIPLKISPEIEANARLIADAPDLLAACVICENALRDHLQYDDGESLERDGFNAAKAAIAKAEVK